MISLEPDPSNLVYLAGMPENLLYKVEHLDKPITLDGRDYEKSVRVIMMRNQKKIAEHFLGVVDKHELYDKIEKGENIQYKSVYVKDFSLSEYRRERGMSEEEHVIFKGWFVLQESLFDCDSVIDFTYAEFQGNTKINKSVFYHGTLDFTHARFYGAESDFSDCHFHTHHAIFQYAEFKGETLSFEHVDFTVDLVSFVSATFKSATTNFKRASFNGCKVKFHFAEFGEGLKTFEKMKFFGPVLDFRRATWGSGKIDFRRAIFGKAHVTFEEMELENAKMTFRLAIFEDGSITFRRSNFGPQGEVALDHMNCGTRSVSFEGVVAGLISISNSDIKSSMDLRIRRVHTIDLSESYLHAITDLSYNKKEALTELNLIKVKNLGKIIIDWEDQGVEQLVKNQDCSDVDMANQFNIIHNTFTNNGQFQDEDHAYVQFKRFEHKVMKEKIKDRVKVAGFLVEIAFFFRMLIFDFVGLFATSPARVLLSMFLTIIGFACIYALMGVIGVGEIVNSVDAADQLNLFQKSLYHSAITFFTIGYGDFYPTSFNRTISAIEGLVGVFLMSYFTVAFVRKILR